jgi:hypothetical protein
MAQDVQQQADELAGQIRAMGDAIVAAWKPLMQATILAMQNFMNQIYGAYVEAGAPYGESQDGMIQWLQEEMAAKHARESAYAIRLREWAVADFGRQIHHPELPPLPVPDPEV